MLCGHVLDYTIYPSYRYCTWECEFIDHIRWKPLEAPLIQQLLPEINIHSYVPFSGVSKEKKARTARTLFSRRFGKG